MAVVQSMTPACLFIHLFPRIIYSYLLNVQDRGAEEHAKQIVILKQDLKENARFT